MGKNQDGDKGDILSVCSLCSLQWGDLMAGFSSNCQRLTWAHPGHLLQDTQAPPSSFFDLLSTHLSTPDTSLPPTSWLCARSVGTSVLCIPLPGHPVVGLLFLLSSPAVVPRLLILSLVLCLGDPGAALGCCWLAPRFPGLTSCCIFCVDLRCPPLTLSL